MIDVILKLVLNVVLDDVVDVVLYNVVVNEVRLTTTTTKIWWGDGWWWVLFKVIFMSIPTSFQVHLGWLVTWRWGRVKHQIFIFGSRTSIFRYSAVPKRQIVEPSVKFIIFVALIAINYQYWQVKADKYSSIYWPTDLENI